MADVVPGSAWSMELDVSAAPDALAAAEWLEDARMEHASIASFSRFTLDLLALGAPPDLVHASGEAMLDEVRHAKLCFALAERFGGAPVEPGPLAMGDVSAKRSLATIVRDAVVEGCIGETLAAVVAAAQHAASTDAAAQAALSVIRDDESCHAELAFRFVRWAIERFGDPAREAAAEGFALARPIRGDDESASPSAGVTRAAGRLSAEERSGVIADAWTRVVEPLADHLLAG